MMSEVWGCEIGSTPREINWMDIVYCWNIYVYIYICFCNNFLSFILFLFCTQKKSWGYRYLILFGEYLCFRVAHGILTHKTRVLSNAFNHFINVLQKVSSLYIFNTLYVYE